ncbi:hypothetical protein [Halorussus litoreus]|nr:hypothetical protein [Halorussus litoreus]
MTGEWRGFGVLGDDSEDAREKLNHLRKEIRDRFAERVKNSDGA